jgi:hypothetical protein
MSKLNTATYAYTLKLIARLLLEGGYQKFTDFMKEQNKPTQLYVLEVMTLFRTETDAWVNQKPLYLIHAATRESLRLKSPGLKGIDEAQKDIKSRPKLTLIPTKQHE